MADNPYTSVTVSGYNQSAPPDDGTRSSNNKVEWQKHLDKIGAPLKTAIEAVNTNTSSAFGDLIVTDDPGQETLITAMRGFMEPPPDIRREVKNLNAAILEPEDEAFVVGAAFFS